MPTYLGISRERHVHPMLVGSAAQGPSVGSRPTLALGFAAEAGHSLYPPHSGSPGLCCDFIVLKVR